MDAELVTLAGTAASTVVTLLVTDGWEKAVAAMGELWRRVHPDRAAAVEADLADARTEILSTPESRAARAERALVTEWQARIGRLLSADPALAGELRRILDTDLRPALPADAPTWTGDVRMSAHAQDQARIYQVGQGSQHITEH